MNNELVQTILRAASIREVKREAARIYARHRGEHGTAWGQADVQEAVVRRKTELLGTRPSRRARGTQEWS